MDSVEERRRKVLEKYTKGKEITSVRHTKNGGKVIQYGKLDFDRLMERLLECKYIVE